MRIALILPTFNNEDLTLKCIQSIDKYVNKNENITIIWIDNNSSFDSRKIILNEFNNLKNIKFENIFLSENLGFIKAVNIGIKFVQKFNYNYIGILNNDIEVTENWLKNLIDILQLDENLVLAGAMQYNINPNEISKLETNETKELLNANSNDFNITAQKVAELNLKPIIYSYEHFKDLSFTHTYVPYFAAIFKPIVFEKVGLLNENFNLGYGDDTEFNFRITKAGYKIAKAKNTIVLHNNRSTFKKLYKDDNAFITKIQEANRLQCKISKSLNYDKKKKYVVYTALIDDYDELKTPTKVDTENFDYICFTNTKSLLSKNIYPWKIIDIQPILNNLNVDTHAKWARYFKTHPHYFFENYEKSLWVDGNVNIIGNLMDFFKKLQNSYIFISDHPLRNNIYEEIKACGELKKESQENLNKVYAFLTKENFPTENTKLVQSGIILRNHHNEKCNFLMDKWWEMINKLSKRDQLSFNYIFWKYNGKYLSIPWNMLTAGYFKTTYKHKPKGK